MFSRLLVTLSFFLVKVIAAHEDLSFTYNGFSSANLSLDGVAEFTPNGLLRLTDIDTQRKGHAFYSNPVTFKNSMNTAAAIFSFSTTFVFAIRSEYPTLSGHGIALVISPTRGLPGTSPNHYLGLFNENNNGNENNHVVAVELDTIKSIDQFDDINNNHVGIDINGLKSEKVYTAGYYNDKNGEFKNLTLVSGKSMKVWVEYDGKKKQMNVTLAPSNIGKPRTPLLSLTRDLSSVVNNTMYVGFSASTGSVPTSHYILGWSFKINGQAQELVLSQLPKLPRMGDKKDRSLILTVGLTLICVIIISLAISGIIYLIKRKRKFEELVEDWEVDYGPQSQRLRIIKGVASGLLYLHEEWEQVVIHRDVKASNVLLDSEFNGRLGDFGLSRLCDHGRDPMLEKSGNFPLKSQAFVLLLNTVCAIWSTSAKKKHPPPPAVGSSLNHHDKDNYECKVEVEKLMVPVIWHVARRGSRRFSS
ncbi:hypothetical protein FNV43_RR08442 [Rhamnella rubrinervis]|uniref:non-specific serine/threonine protein kinase n=1 Tax=Rhamnella rubrinervis TaxID=2594499 RepID=A0A8K0MIS1_9ROSA|nr:hypothetical protein FNV43_RR08442 [Rhamnella rubrinervis]